MLLLMAVVISLAMSMSAKSYNIDFSKPTNVTMTRSASSGKKMVLVEAYGSNVDKALDNAMVDAVRAVTFTGISNPESMESLPSILIEGQKQYSDNKKFFKDFFKKGMFLPFVKRVTDSYPSGTNNVRTSKGQKVSILIIVDWKGLEEFYRNNGLKTQLSTFVD